MPYLFALLLAVNAAAMGYFMFLDNNEQPDASVMAAKASITKPVNVINKTAEIPPEIGEK